MKYVYVGVEFTHDERHPQASLIVSTRAGKVHKWTGSMKPTVINGLLRERVGLRLPFGFRFQKDMIRDTMSKHKTYTWTDAKFLIAKLFAIGIYRPYEQAVTDAKPKEIEATPVQAEGEELCHRH